MTSTLPKQTAKWIQKLAKACDGDVGHAKQQLKWLKEKVFQDNRGSISLNSEALSTNEKIQLEKYISERVDQNKPLQYILGTQPFCELDIVTRPPTLIPRWETEEWTYKVVQLMHQHLNKSDPIRILDLCTGSGCIALALAKHLPKDSARIVGLDVSSKAISLANHNLSVHSSSIQNDVRFQQKDLFNLDGKEPFNLIVSNPPYITHKEYDTLDPDVKDWEDSRALVADEEGTHVHKKIIQIAEYCKPYASGLPRLVMEMGGTHQIECLTEEMGKCKFTDIKVWKDLANKDRVILGS